jgi:hypothetical protein
MLLSFLACSQIWLNLHLDHCQFGWITKLTKKHTAWGCSRQTALEDGQDIWRYNYENYLMKDYFLGTFDSYISLKNNESVDSIIAYVKPSRFFSGLPHLVIVFHLFHTY